MKEQAVYALQCDGLTVRAIAERTEHLRAKWVASRALLIVSGGTATIPGLHSAARPFRAAEFRDRVRLAWGFR